MQQGLSKEQIAQNIMASWQTSGLKQRLIYTFLAIAFFRLGAQLPIFGVNNEVFSSLAGNNIVGFLDMFTGGALGKVSIFALGIGPYITSSIIIQLLAVVVPSLERLQKEEGEGGRRKLQQITRQFTVFLAALQALAFVIILSKITGAVIHTMNPILFNVGSIIALTAGAILIMWLAELITEKGVGNGGSLLIFVGILSGIPLYIRNTHELVMGDSGMQLRLVMLLLIFVAAIIAIIFFQDATRNVPIVSARRQVGNKVYGGGSSSIPFKLNPGGVMPIIFAIAILLFPTTILEFATKMNISNEAVKNVFMTMSQFMSPSSPFYYLIYFGLIVVLTFFYSSIIPNMQPKEIATNLKKYGSAIPGVKPGKPTEEKLDEILSRVTFIGAISLGIIALVPSLASKLTSITTFQGIGSTSLIIMVGVALDFVNQIKAHLYAKNYESFLQKNGVK